MPSNIGLVHQLSPQQIEELHALYQTQWWTSSRSLASVHTMIHRTSFLFGLVDHNDNDSLVGFARVLSDCVYKALIFDLIVNEKYRKQGLGVRLMQSIKSHPELAEVKHFELYCHPDMVQFYEQQGFTSDLPNHVLMRKEG